MCVTSPVTLRPQLEVQCPPGVTIGFVRDHWNLCRAVYSIQDARREAALRVRGPCSTYGCGADSVFQVRSPEERSPPRLPAGFTVIGV